uniref:Putative tyrosine phosphatase protein n=1 Tax=Toxoneuron nigriceps polydnavirus TaxID=191766 RepID=Q5W3L1_9VIRU|nr:putative tyrosine phosphatase protein [Toxoneuron nigriceps polydnavirus]
MMVSLKTLGAFTSEELLLKAKQEGFYLAVKEEFQKLTSVEEKNQNYHFNLPQNRCKNRFMHIPCPDFSRVLLNGNEDSYIHANYLYNVDSDYSEFGFIATQTPLENTAADFYQMVWEKSRIIVMLERMMLHKCYQYWKPFPGKQMIAGNFKITTVYVVNYDHYVLTTLSIKHMPSGKVKKVNHYLYTRWPMYGIPNCEKKFFEFLQVIRRKNYFLCQKYIDCYYITVHCNSGVGKTGVFCAIMNGMKSFEKYGKVNLFEIVRCIRSTRPLSVTSLNQYKFCYKLLIYYSSHVRTIFNKNSVIKMM